MLKKILIVACIWIATSSLNAYEYTPIIHRSHAHKAQTNWISFTKRLIDRAISNISANGVAVGLGTFSGGITAFLDRYVPFSLFIIWPAEMYARHLALEGIEDEMHKDAITHDHQSMYWSARIASWVSWVIVASIFQNPASHIRAGNITVVRT